MQSHKRVPMPLTTLPKRRVGALSWAPIYAYSNPLPSNSLKYWTNTNVQWSFQSWKLKSWQHATLWTVTCHHERGVASKHSCISYILLCKTTLWQPSVKCNMNFLATDVHSTWGCTTCILHSTSALHQPHNAPSRVGTCWSKFWPYTGNCAKSRGGHSFVRLECCGSEEVRH